MVRLTLLFAVAIAFSANCFAEAPPAEKTILKVYPVGDLVSAGAMKSNIAGSKISSEEWTSEYPETLQALEELRSIVETMCTQKPVAVKTYTPSLSLIVKHSQAGHDEISQLLRTLGEGNNVTIHMECHWINIDSLDGLINSEGTNSKKKQLELLLVKSKLIKAETTKLLAICPSIEAYNQTVKLKSGHRTTWGFPIIGACTAMGRVNRSKNSVDIRIDYVADDYYSDGIPVGSQTFSLSEGESALFRHNFDGGTTVWLITTRIIPQEKPASLISQKY